MFEWAQEGFWHGTGEGRTFLMHGLVWHGNEATLPYSVKWQNGLGLAA
jgi:hypothetical protein